jgi:hypothetical protein
MDANDLKSGQKLFSGGEGHQHSDLHRESHTDQNNASTHHGSGGPFSQSVGQEPNMSRRGHVQIDRLYEEPAYDQDSKVEQKAAESFAKHVEAEERCEHHNK